MKCLMKKRALADVNCFRMFTVSRFRGRENEIGVLNIGVIRPAFPPISTYWRNNLRAVSQD